MNIEKSDWRKGERKYLVGEGSEKGEGMDSEGKWGSGILQWSDRKAGLLPRMKRRRCEKLHQILLYREAKRTRLQMVLILVKK